MKVQSYLSIDGTDLDAHATYELSLHSTPTSYLIRELSAGEVRELIKDIQEQLDLLEGEESK
jgi:hypothetical protein